MIVSAVSAEAAIISIVGSVTGLAVSLLLASPLSESIRSYFSLPFMQPDGLTLAVLVSLAFAVHFIIVVLSAMFSALRITKNETGLLLREDA